jgi:adenosine deaminase
MFQGLPKIELHCHLDASVRIQTVAEVGRELGLNLPAALRTALVAPDTCFDLADYIRRIDLALEVMQEREALTRIAREFVEDLAADGIIYGEVRFAPQLHTRRSLSLQEVVDAVHEGLQQGRQQYGVGTGLILCCLRHEPVAVSFTVAKLAVANMDKVCALDLAGDEARFPGAPHAQAFELARSAGLARTVHAGEAAGPESVEEALDVLFAQRIGHGVRVEASPQLSNRVRHDTIPLEMCPTSNVQTRAVASFQSHPIDRLLRKGLRVTVSTDGRTVSETSVTSEFERLAQGWRWGLNEFWICQKNAAEAAFVSPRVRQELLARIEPLASSAEG